MLQTMVGTDLVCLSLS